MCKKIILILFSIKILIYSSKSQIFSGKIERFENKPLTIYLHVGDTLLPIQQVITNHNGEFIIDLKQLNDVFDYLRQKYGISKYALLRIEFDRELNQFADFLVQTYYEPTLSIKKELNTKDIKKNIHVRMIYSPSKWFNFAIDNIEILLSEENKRLYEFLRQWRKIQVAENWLLEMSRLFPYADEFSKTLINEYYKRYKRMKTIVKEHLKHPNNPVSKIVLAYYRPIVPDYSIPDGDRFKIFREHFWDYFDPNDSLFFYTPVLIDKFEEWVYLHHHHKEGIAGLYLEKEDIIEGINSFIEKIDKNEQNRNAVIEYALKKLDKDIIDKELFLAIYDRWLKPQEGDCRKDDNKWEKYHNKATLYKKVIIGAKAPDFEIIKEKLRMHDIPSDYLLLIFCANWCNHCFAEIPKIRLIVEEFNSKNQKSIVPLFISLDTSHVEWLSFINKHNLQNYINMCDYKGWKGEIVKLYNVYEIPTIFLLDKNKTIITKTTSHEQLNYLLNLKN